MIVPPEIAALRSDDAPQRRIQGACVDLVKAWRAAPQFAGIEQQFLHYAQGTSLADLPLLAQLFSPGSDQGQNLIADLMNRLIRFVADEPMTQIALRHHISDLGAGLILSQAGGSVLLLQLIDGSALSRKPRATSVTFTPGDTHELVLAGAAETDEVTLLEERPGGVRLECRPRQIAAGDVLFRDGASQAQLIRSASPSLVSLKLQRRATSNCLTREFALEDGRFLRQASGTAAESRLELAAALLGRMKRKDAAPLLAAMAGEQAGQSLRWQALRECLGLDTAIGFAALCTIAADENDPLAGPAGALKAQLLETYPALQGLNQCPV